MRTPTPDLIRLLVLSGMRARGRGHIVNLGSAAGLVTPPTGCPYAMSKYALESLCDALRLEVAPFGIRVSLIEPGAVRTEFLANSARHSPADNGAGPYAGFRANVATVPGTGRFRAGQAALPRDHAGRGPTDPGVPGPGDRAGRGDEAAGGRLGSAVVATPHGHATLLLDGTFGPLPDAAEAAAGHAEAAARALTAGRSWPQAHIMIMTLLSRGHAGTTPNS